ncbi:hypothetical protein GCM10011415_32480 [Salipiger pallidus]|uniref:Uncharacterized protein n=1 Tax=Salipiger pallidus TaxID=1775170 RepID=A0A8J2ZME2_9RHOB|nr:hypothetical protein GCM10011415_32480 [Salipiger pallidus]
MPGVVSKVVSTVWQVLGLVMVGMLILLFPAPSLAWRRALPKRLPRCAAASAGPQSPLVDGSGSCATGWRNHANGVKNGAHSRNPSATLKPRHKKSMA